MSTTKNISTTFITDDIVVKDFNFEAIERYELTLQQLNQKEYDYTGKSKSFQQWANDHLSFEKLYELPMMTSVYYYPSFISFNKKDRYKTAPTTTLFYDTEEQSWAVGLTGGGMDLSPNLLATFIALGKGVPNNVARAVRKEYPAYINAKEHQENCDILGKAFEQEAIQCTGIAKRLRI